jgi:hypothetical protein
MIVDILLTSLTLSLAILGLWISFNWQGMLLEPLAYRVEQFCYTHSLPHQLLKPLWACPTCMSSFWSLVFFALLGHRYLPFASLLVIIPATAFINTLGCMLLSHLSDQGCN